MPDQLPSTYDEEYTLIMQGYDVSIVPSDQGPGYYYATLSEGGSEVFSLDLPLPEAQPGETSEELIENLAQAAIDLFEAERGTLGEGAGAEMTAKKSSYYGLDYGHEDWFMSFKGTSYEGLAYDLLKAYYGLEVEEGSQDNVLHEMYDRRRDIEFE